MVKNGLRFWVTENMFPIYETFERRQYGVQSLSGEVVDLGANTGDSTIYSASRGASRVIALEPLPSICQWARRNVDLNGLTGTCEVLNAASGPKERYIAVPVGDSTASGSFVFCGEQPIRRHEGSSTVIEIHL